MDNFVKRMIVEHRELSKRIEALDRYIYVENGRDDDKVEFANKCLQLNHMKHYEEALRARLINQNIVIECGEYFEHISEEDLVSESPNDKKDNE